MEKKLAIVLPEGCFEGNCSDCVYADWDDKDEYGRVYCDNGYGYNKASERNGCFGWRG